MPLLTQPFDPFINAPESAALAEFLLPQVRSSLKLKRFSKKKYHYHVTKIVLNLYHAWSSNPDKCVGISRGKNYYDMDQGIYQNKNLSHTYITQSLDSLVGLQYLELVQGGWIDREQGISESSRYRASKTLI